MKKTSLIISILVSVFLMLTSMQQAEAKRLGGGSSFGSKPSYSQPYQGPTSSNTFSQPLRSPASTAAASQNQAAKQNWASRGGLMGMLGGLALGGILGSMFFGGAFEHFNFMDFFIFAGIAYLAYRLFAARSASRQQQPLSNAYSRNNYQENYNHPEAAMSGNGLNTDLLFNKGKPAQVIPAGFDQVSFLAGAERAYRHLQACWDNRDLSSIRALATDKVFAEIQDQLRSSTESNKTEVLQLHVELLDIREVGSEYEATVLFDAVMRENNSPTEQIREVWHFVKPINSPQPKWFLDGIQQVQS